MSKGNKKTKPQKQNKQHQPNTQGEELSSILNEAPKKRNVTVQQDVKKGDLVTSDGKKAHTSKIQNSSGQLDGSVLRPNPASENSVNTEQSSDNVMVRSFDSAVDEWLVECFGETIARDTVERNHRFLEESLELIQSCGASAAEAHKMVDYVFSRPRGDKRQEVGGAYITLIALCKAHHISLLDAGSEELNRCCDNIVEIREKQRNKPRFSALPK